VAPGLLVLFRPGPPRLLQKAPFWTFGGAPGRLRLFLWYNEFSADVDVPLPLILMILAVLLRRLRPQPQEG